MNLFENTCSILLYFFPLFLFPLSVFRYHPPIFQYGVENTKKNQKKKLHFDKIVILNVKGLSDRLKTLNSLT